MTISTRYIAFWAPRVLGLVFAAFTTLFAFDVFSERSGFWQTTSALAVHLLPAAIILAIVAVAWRWERLGGALMIVAGLGYSVAVTVRHQPASWILNIGGPLFIVGLLFLLSSSVCQRSPRRLE